MSTNYTNPANRTDAVAGYGFERTDTGICCQSCGYTFRLADGSIMRSHARKCETNPREYRVPGVCEA